MKRGSAAVSGNRQTLPDPPTRCPAATHGMNFSPDDSAAMTLPSALRDVLMACASFRRSPVAPVLDCFSLPARSISDSFPVAVLRVARLRDVTHSENTRCDRERVAFIAVDPTCRAAFPSANAASTSAAVAHGRTTAPRTLTRPLSSFLMSRRGGSSRGADGFHSRSTRLSRYNSVIVTVTLTSSTPAAPSMRANRRCTARGVMPGAPGAPTIVKVLPLRWVEVSSQGGGADVQSRMQCGGDANEHMDLSFGPWRSPVVVRRA